jgi:hypothetical protein
MRTAATATALGITLSIAALASCANPRPGEMPVPTPSVTPVFASEEEALAAAGEAYQRYLDVTNLVGQSGWKDTSKLPDVSRGDALDAALANAEQFAQKGWIQTGDGSFDTLSIQQFDDGGAGSVEIVAYLCLIVSGVDVLDANGASVVSPDRPDRLPFEVQIDDSERKMKIARSEAWSGASFC